MKKLFIFGAAFLAIFALAGCSQFGIDETQTTVAVSDKVTSVENVASTLDVNELALQAASINSLVIPFLSQSSVTQVSILLADEPTDEPQVGTEITDLDRYLELLNQLLDNNDGLTVNVDTSDRVEYQYMATYTVVSLIGEPKTYTLYYNEVLADEPSTDDSSTTTDSTTTEQPTTEAPTTEVPTTEVPTTEEPTTETDPVSIDNASSSILTLGYHQDHPFQFPCEDDDSETVVVQIQGLLVTSDTETALEGALLSTDTEDILRLYAYVDNDNYIKLNVLTNTEDLTQKFFYRVVQDGVVVSESNIRVSQEDDGLSVKLQIIDGNQTVNFKANQETTDGVTNIRIRYDITVDGVLTESGNVIITKTVDEVTGEDVYQYTVLPDGAGYGYHYYGDGGHHGCSKGEPFTGDDQQPPFGHKDNVGSGNNHSGGNDGSQGHHGGGHRFGMTGPDQGETNSSSDDSTETPTPDPDAVI